MSPRRLFRSTLLLGAILGSFWPSIVSGVETPQVCAGQSAVGLPEWMRSAVIYEINVRQYSEAGTFQEVTRDLPRLKSLGVDVLWLMPIHPIGKVNRKGPLGSYYAISDYLAINPEFGTKDQFRQLVDTAHAQGFRVILDWVGNHTAWDHPLAKEHPEYYVRDGRGAFQPPTGFDWTDVIQLDFSRPEVLEYQVSVLTHWVREYGVDGFRCDFATGVPTAFWEKLIARVREVRKDVFFLAESELPQHQLRAFNASYGFEMMHTLNEVAQGRSGVSHVDDTLAQYAVQFPKGASLMFYTSNHDENTWQGTEFERLGGGARTSAVLTYALGGIPLIYNGQEIGLDHRIEFFQRDPIRWPADAAEHPYAAFYRTLNHLRKTHPALHAGSSSRRLPTTKNDSAYVVLRESGGKRVVFLLNLTARDVTFQTWDPALAGTWIEVFSGEKHTQEAGLSLTLKAWEYRVLSQAP